MLDSDALPAPLAESESIRQAQKELDRIAQTPQEREAYRSRLMWLRDDRARMSDARKLGAVMGQIQTLQEILQRPVTSLEELSSPRIEDLTRLRDELKADLQLPR